MSETKKPQAANEDAKARFKAVLDAKNRRAKEAHGGGDADGGQGATKGPQNASSGPQFFRRKAGG
jgi:hypothetical protein